MTSAQAFRWSAAFGFAGVALGAFGAHGLRPILEQHGARAIWETAVLYHLTHAVAMLALASTDRWRAGPWVLFGVGICLFSGSLYLLAVTGVRAWGAVTPAGGISLLGGWLWLALRPRKSARSGPGEAG